MSGGTASAVACVLLKNLGLEVEAVYFSAGSESVTGGLTTPACLQDRKRLVEKICKKLAVPLHQKEVGELFEAVVLDQMVHDRVQGHDSHPCVRCHQSIKLKLLFDLAEKMGFDHVSTGHFVDVHVSESTGEVFVRTSADASLDQSSVFFECEEQHLRKMITPLGGLTEKMVIRLAAEFELGESDEFELKSGCHFNQAQIGPWIESRVDPELRQSGSLKLIDGTTLGEHKGVHQFQIGQLLPTRDQRQKAYILSYEPKTRSVLVGKERQLYYRGATVYWVHWLQRVNPIREFSCQAKLSLDQGSAFDCMVTVFENRTLKVIFAQHQKLYPGSMIAFFDGKTLLGGGWIERVDTPIELEQKS